jgi:hypothetical protein
LHTENDASCSTVAFSATGRQRSREYHARMIPKLSDDAREYFRQQGAKGGKIGGKRAAAKLSPTQRKARAIKASKAAALARAKKKRATENNGK